MATRILLLILLAMAAAGGIAAGQQPAAPARPSQPAPRDAELERAIRERFARSKAASDNFQVSAQGGVVTLRGKTDVVQRKAAATRMAKSAGARKVINEIQVTREAREKAAAGLSQNRRRAEVKRSERP
ncbi:MAG: BON domain-containing protein [Bryobacteraceae bacterium]